ncbi:hypothetical protein DYI25_01335 [Mesobacillus boroniphilus]|uniref:Uncharacterized protein n=1 Tax=Mesobacillus boroniphilus TaxID=308892 RepID=A0A944CIH0_9BACI|nr:hypothetical protein [Mesobacillus boroniphilus]MBS8263075.1 hypothetical protein [Mesobacillus boroniphilus]
MEDGRSRDLFGFKLKRENDEGSDQQEQEYTHFDQFMFGRPSNKEEESEQSVKNNSPLNKYLGQIDLDEVMYHVDTLITSARELKPLVGKVRPLFDHFIEKNKS